MYVVGLKESSGFGLCDIDLVERSHVVRSDVLVLRQ